MKPDLQLNEARPSGIIKPVLQLHMTVLVLLDFLKGLDKNTAKSSDIAIYVIY